METSSRVVGKAPGVKCQETLAADPVAELTRDEVTHRNFKMRTTARHLHCRWACRVSAC